MTEGLHSIFRQLNELKGSASAVKNLLREIQGQSEQARSEINISGTKEELIQNLSRAVGKDYIPLQDVQQLLWDLEEVGKQHVLLLKRAPEGLADARTNFDPHEITVALFDDMNVQELFPRYEYPSSGFIWVDFRTAASESWLAKAYGRELYRQSQGLVSTEELDDGTIQEVRQYSWKEVKTTLVANWRGSDEILELRIDISNLQTAKTIDERREHLWTLLGPVIRKSDLIGADVDNLLHKLIFERHKPDNRNRYSIGRVELTDPRSGQIRVVPHSSEPLDNDEGRKASLRAMQENAFTPSLVRIEWKSGLPGCPDCMTEPVSVVLEKTSNGPELRILKRITGATYEYIFDQLRCRF